MKNSARTYAGNVGTTYFELFTPERERAKGGGMGDGGLDCRITPILPVDIVGALFSHLFILLVILTVH